MASSTAIRSIRFLKANDLPLSLCFSAKPENMFASEEVVEARGTRVRLVRECERRGLENWKKPCLIIMRHQRMLKWYPIVVFHILPSTHGLSPTEAVLDFIKYSGNSSKRKSSFRDGVVTLVWFVIFMSKDPAFLILGTLWTFVSVTGLLYKIMEMNKI